MPDIPVNDLARAARAHADELMAAVSRVTSSGWYIMGRELEAFEHAFAQYCGAAACVGVGNGTDALELALRGLGVHAGDEVVTVANAGLYSSIAIRAIGARPVYVDVDAGTHLIDVRRLSEALRPSVRAIVATHLYGRMTDMTSIMSIAAKAGVPVIEDCAQAHGALRDERKAGTAGAVGCFSFYPTKNLGALGDGGAMVTNDADLAAELRRLRQYGWSSKYLATRSGGRNSRLDEIQAAVLAAKLPHLDAWNERRRRIADRYTRAIRHPAIRPALSGAREFVAHLYVVTTERRDELRRHLASRGVGTDVHYPTPDHQQPAFADGATRPVLPVTETAARQVLSLPCFPELTDDEVERVVAACNDWER